MLIKLHSFTDIITNSSTTVYSHLVSSGVDMIKELISDVLKAVNSDKKVDDLFEIKEVFDIGRFNDAIDDEPEEYLKDEQLKEWEKLDWKEQTNYIEKHLSKELEVYYRNYEDDYGATYDSDISIKSKTDDKDLSSLINNLFEVVAYRDG